MKKSIYYRLLMYFYTNGDDEVKDFIKFILEHEAIKHGLSTNNCRNVV